MKHGGEVPESFKGTDIFFFLVSSDKSDRRRYLPCTEQDGVLEVEIDGGTLPVGLYGVEVVWYRNKPIVDCFETCKFAPDCGYGERACKLDPPCSPRVPMHGFRDIMRVIKPKLFVITDVKDEENVDGSEGTVVISAKVCACTYGYDGLSAYEIAVMQGKTTLSEKEWIESLKGDIDYLTYWEINHIIADVFGF